MKLKKHLVKGIFYLCSLDGQTLMCDIETTLISLDYNSELAWKIHAAWYEAGKYSFPDEKKHAVSEGIKLLYAYKMSITY